MSTAEEILTGPLVLTPRQRRNPVVFPEDPTDEELARDWTLSEADKTEVLRCRTNRHPWRSISSAHFCCARKRRAR
jgi:hypothetical protein